MSSELPQGWGASYLTDVAIFQEGPGLRKWQFGKSGIPFLNIRTFSDGQIDRSRCQFVKIEEFTGKYEHFLLDEGDIVVSSSGTLGKLAIVRATDLPLMLNTSTIRFRTRSSEVLTQDFLRWYLQSPRFFRQIEAAKTGSAIFNYGPSHLKDMDIVLPPVAEQRRIVATLDKLARSIRTCRTGLQRVPAILKRFRQAVLAAAYSGRLTADWREHNHNVQPLLCGGSEEVAEPPLDLPESWRWVKWKDVTAKGKHSFKRGPFGSALKKELFVKEGYKVYEQCCPINDDCTLGKYYVTEEKFRELEAFKVNAGDLLISCSGVTLGRITRIPTEFEPGIINQALLKVTLDEALVLPAYFVPFFRSDFFQRLIFENSQGSAIPNVRGAKELKELPIPLAPIAEQREIVDRVDELFRVADRIEARQQCGRRFVDGLVRAILSKAFRGELVPTEAELARREGREYEPASVLLERIKKMREEETSSVPKRMRTPKAKLATAKG